MFAAPLDDRAFVLRHAITQLLLWSAFYYLLPAILPHVIDQTNWSGVTLSGSFSLAFLLWAVLCPIVGTIVDRGGAVLAMRAAGVVGAVCLTMAALAQSQTIACVAIIMLGGPMAMTLYDPCFSLMIRRYGAGISARRAITTVTLIAGFATLLTFPLVAWLSDAGVGWRWIIMLFAAAVVLAVRIMPSETGQMRPVEEPKIVSTKPASGRAVTIGVAFSLIMLGHALLLFQLPLQLVRMSDDNTALMLPMVLGPAQIVGRLLWQLVQDRMRLESATIVLFCMMIVPPLLLLTLNGVGVALVALIVQGAGYGIHTVIRPMFAAGWLPRSGFARQLGVIAMIGLLMMAVAPVVGAWIADAFGFAGLIHLVLAADVAGLLLLIGLVAASRKQEAI